ncbi:hypothetical protein ACN47E_009156 [Coniothyrium glycines]
MSGSMKDAIKALNTTFSATTIPDPLPEELRAAVESFLNRYENIDDHDSQRFHEDLHALYLRHVADHPEKHRAFLAALRMVRPAITGESRLAAWWTLVVQPRIDTVGHKRCEIEDAEALVQSILVYDPEDDQDGELARLSNIFLDKVLQAYLARTDMSATSENIISVENESIAHELEEVLVTFGRRMPKALMTALDRLFVQRHHRIQALNLLSAFVRLQPPHLHLVLETSLIQNLERCLLIDTSSTVVDLALVVLIMFLPHICGALPSDHHLEKLFLIYCRILCWDKLGYANSEDGNDEASPEESDDGDRHEDDSDLGWDQFHESTEHPNSSPPVLMHYFTFLYGLFPQNFMSFIRKPRKYLKQLNFPGARDFDLDQDFIHSRTEPYRKAHLLHPNMFTTTVEDELNENRWLKSDPADVVMECMDLCLATSSTLQDPGPPPSAALPPVPRTSQLAVDEDGTTIHESDGSWRNTQSTLYVPSSEAPELHEPSEEPLSSRSIKSAKSNHSLASPLPKSREMMDSPTLPPVKDIKQQENAGNCHVHLHKTAPHNSSLDDLAHAARGHSSSVQTENHSHTMGSLQREIMLLRNDLNFERYLKLQHLTHIGQLQRKNIKEATAEADTQNLINANKTLKARLAKANELYTKMKKETLTSRSQSKKWENDLSNKVRTYKESEKSWHNEEGSLRFNLQRTQSDYDQLKKLVEGAEAEQLKAQQRTRALEFELEDYGNVRRELEIAQEKVLASEDQRKVIHALMRERNDLRNDLEIANMRLNSREVERERAIKAYERRIMELEARLQATDRDAGRPGQLSPAVQQMLDSTLAASNAKLQQLKKTYCRLLEQHTELQMKYFELEGEQQAELGPMQSSQRGGPPDVRGSSVSRGPSIRAGNQHNSQYAPLSTHLDEREFQFEHGSAVLSSPTSPTTSGRSTRFESMTLQKPQRTQTTPLPYPGSGGGGPGPDYSAAYESTLTSQLQSHLAQSSGKSSLSVETGGSDGKDKKDKVDTKSEVRVYGRGGAQNNGKKAKDKEQKKSTSKTGGFRGLKGIM